MSSNTIRSLGELLSLISGVVSMIRPSCLAAEMIARKWNPTYMMQKHVLSQAHRVWAKIADIPDPLLANPHF